MSHNDIWYDNYPVAIDPSSQFISVRASLDGANGVRWINCRRMPPAGVNSVLPTSNHRCHFFVDGDTFESSKIVLSYDAVGAISGLWNLKGSQWVDTPLPEEHTGQVSLCPSVRFQFLTVADRDLFLKNLKTATDSVANSKAINQQVVVTLLRALGRCPTPPRVVHVLANIPVDAATE